MIPKAKKDSSWEVDPTFLRKIDEEIRSQYKEFLELEEIESVILILIKKGYLKFI